jgi:cytoskeletal protein RodZ
MENLGQYLKSLREEKQITLETVTREIKLTTEQISAIESNQLSKLGNYGFGKATVYTYIRFLEADEKVAMNLLDLLMPSSKQADFEPKTPIREKKVLISINFIWLVAILLIVAVLGSIIWISYSRGYLKRPFDNVNGVKDSLKSETPEQPKVVKPDTIRAHMLKIANTVAKKSANPVTKKAEKPVKPSQSVPDTTDYANEMIFDGKESPFNQRN